MRTWLLGLAVLGVACGGSTPNVADGGPPPGGGDASTVEVSHSCAELSDLYITALALAKSCDPDAGLDQCLATVSTDLSCACQTYVQDASALNALLAEWQAQSCQASLNPMFSPCPGACPPSKQGSCIAVAGGGSCALPPPGP
jgi:hypothetical protein